MDVLPPERSLITCHDVLAIRGALGDPSAWAKPSATGRLLQHWIRSHLLRSHHIVCVSETTRMDLLRLPGKRPAYQRIRVIPNGIDPVFSPSIPDQASADELPKELQDNRFLLHVGTSHPRKNRSILIPAFDAIANDYPDLRMVFAGEAFNRDEQNSIQSLSSADRFIHMGRVSDAQLSALYRHATGLLFPSLSEGFGWPILEAQSSRCPVACSDLSSLPEVAGEGACLFQPSSVASIAQAMRCLVDPHQRQTLIEAGSANCERFSPDQTIEAYIRFYKDLRFRPDTGLAL